MVEINFKIIERDDNKLDIIGRGSLYAPYSGHEVAIAKAIIPKLLKLLMELKEEFPTKVINIAEFDSPLNKKIHTTDEPWKFPRRGDLS